MHPVKSEYDGAWDAASMKAFVLQNVGVLRPLFRLLTDNRSMTDRFLHTGHLMPHRTTLAQSTCM
jgi:hypothetical protein